MIRNARDVLGVAVDAASRIGQVAFRSAGNLKSLPADIRLSTLDHRIFITAGR